ncbi:sensor histidine kinase [Pelagicoccus mobilis]|uniref:Sensor histidine kinase n=1 Tax=Pelagicoccus mobilis TaxID=415221 RepID=A0A934RYG3_9BACT|nr:sensor histidine kinase [Pelagicoccus mobilis]MBK1877800.1 sensor histidine kinase [Pelagicoccus mobilis]
MAFRRRLLMVSLVLSAFLCVRGSLGQETEGLITTCAEIRVMSSAEADEGRPVRLRGVVTSLSGFAHPVDLMPFTLDDGTGIWVRRKEMEAGEQGPALELGDLVEVEGITLKGNYLPSVMSSSVRFLGKGSLPDPLELSIHELNTGDYDSRRIQVSGVIQAVEFLERPNFNELRLGVRSRFGECTFRLAGADLEYSQAGLIDAKVTLTGVCLSFFNARRQFLAARIYTNDPADLVVDELGNEDPFSVRLAQLSEVMSFDPSLRELHRTRVRGTVTLSSPGEFFYLQAGDLALKVNTSHELDLQVGERVEASGFLHMPHNRAEMFYAICRELGEGEPVVPVLISLDEALASKPQRAVDAKRDYDDILVSLRGELVSIDQREGEPLRLSLESDGGLVPVVLLGEGHAFDRSLYRVGSVLEATGVCRLSYSESGPVLDWPEPESMSLLVDDLSNVVVVSPASIWTNERLARVLMVAVVVIVAGVGWIVLLRRTVAIRSKQLSEEMRARRDAAVEFESSLRERTRLAADLHDTMEQSLTGLALQLDATDALKANDAQRSQHHLSLARQLLGRSREDLRRSIWNLRDNPLDKLTLFEALEEVAENRSAGLPVSISVNVSGDEREVADFVGSNLLLLAQEAITNAFKHGEASSIELRLEFGVGEVRLSVCDDGKGFDPVSAVGPSEGHFGLQGMRERVKRLGGELKIESAVGEGTTVVASVKDETAQGS